MQTILAALESSTNRLFTYYCDNVQHTKALKINKEAFEFIKITYGKEGFMPGQLLAVIAAKHILNELIPNVNAPGIIQTHENNLKDIALEIAEIIGISASSAEKSFAELGSDSVRVMEMVMETLKTPENVEGFSIEKLTANKTINAEYTAKTLGDNENNKEQKVVEMFKARDGRIVLTDGKDVFLYSAYNENGDPAPDADIDLENSTDEITYADLLEFRNETELQENKTQDALKQISESAGAKTLAEESVNNLGDVVADTLVDIANQEVYEELVSREAEFHVETGATNEEQDSAFNLATNKLENYKIAKGKKNALKAYLESQDLGYALEDIEAGEPLVFETEIIEALKEFLTVDQPK
ncbi:hypothetical protein MA9V1_136 [Chryseobacterium phage MA9V-1]|nr:hypothetical protein MA9V1_136 [Chryseobacterium phage MA9V-1]